MNFETYPKNNFVGFLSKFRSDLIDWIKATIPSITIEANAFNIDEIGHCLHDISTLLNRIEEKKALTFFFFDEIQRLFQHDPIQVKSYLPWLKAIMYTYNRKHIFIAMTGSAMVTTFINLWSMPPNGGQLMADVSYCIIQPNQRDTVVQIMKEQLKACYEPMMPEFGKRI
jgi:hypothetical protein